MTKKTEINAWTRYWQADRLDSCIAGGGEADEADVFRLWAGFLANLPADASVLDLAAGNGAVAVRLLKAAREADKKVSVHAVDMADIDPAQFLRDHQETASDIAFRGGVDISALPFGDASFDGAVSQFGFEYADTSKAAAEMLRILNPGGRFQMLMHHKNSALVAPNIAQITEIDRLFSADGVIERLTAYLSAPLTAQANAFTALEEAGQMLLNIYQAGLPRITEEIFSAVHQLVERTDLGLGVRLQAANDMAGRMKAERERMRQLSEAAQSAADIKTLVDTLEHAGASHIEAIEFKVGTDAALLGWLLHGHKA